MTQININKDDYPSNSFSGRKNKPEPKSVTSARVVNTEKKSFLARFIGETGMSVVDYIFRDVLVPAAKSTISDIIGNGIEMLLYGESTTRTGSRSRRDRVRTKVSYTDYYDRRERGGRETSSRERRRDRHDFDQFVISNRREAQDVINQLAEIIDTWDVATVSDLYRLLDLDNEWTDNKYGWYNISRAGIIPVRNGYILDLPRPEVID